MAHLTDTNISVKGVTGIYPKAGIDDFWTANFAPWCAIILIITGTFWRLLEGHRVWWEPDVPNIFWSSDVWSRHNSQQIFDPYTFTHLIYGFICFWAIKTVFHKLAVNWQLCMAIALACLWELVENSALMTERYRLLTGAVDYAGDAYLNSLTDILACGVGFSIARRLSFTWFLIILVAVETLTLFWIRDNLILNLIMLIYPVDWLRHWQMGG